MTFCHHLSSKFFFVFVSRDENRKPIYRHDLLRDLQQNNAKLFSEKSKKMKKDMGNVELLGYVRQIPKCNAENAFFTGIRASFIALAGISCKKVKSAEASFNGHWIFSQFKIMSLRRDDFMDIDMGRRENKKTIILPIF